ncbi:hypothetical protein LZZ85_16230 [Terrimonas sp. NA20]|uniref:SH3 domain-containing protein n=1 Tax=Terrimonas ginsenosidimutans TaxID=2908004 RepID=A0ABS9KU42_9BACT|nr:hypothetical protein [Terrimonas ginsenosidimutans]MCG2615844.1 hypothetical protein [Terrimonas ginsenosidimutans]
MTDDNIYKDKDFAIYCLTLYFRGNKQDLSIALADLKASNKTAVEFLEQFFQRKNEDKEAITKQINEWKRTYKKKKKLRISFRKLLLPIGILVLFAAGYFAWKAIAAGDPVKEPENPDRLYVITTSGFRARNTPSSPGGNRKYFRYGDTVTNLHDTLNGWVKFSSQEKLQYGPSKYFATESVFRAHDSLFADFHYLPSLETINSKAAFCIREFIDRSLHSSVKEWHIPLQSLEIKPARHAVLSLPRAVDYVKVDGEGELEKYHLLLVSRRQIQSPDSINHYALLLELLPNGSVIRRADFPLSIAETSCYITVNNVDRFLRGNINGNVFLRTDKERLLRLNWTKGMEAPKWEWME